MASNRHKIVVCVDYGTTNTGASYVSTGGKSIGDITLIKSWPGPAKSLSPSHTMLKRQ
ncbi:hypothetical protein BDW69DRAFT_188009 [Aspergillus filifer]